MRETVVADTARSLRAILLAALFCTSLASSLPDKDAALTYIEADSPQPDTLRLLFVGNSLLYENLGAYKVRGPSQLENVLPRLITFQSLHNTQQTGLRHLLLDYLWAE